ncbi:MAG: hypothetical protein A3D28_00610 [Omnitrophica bacterium RIFCSPHIGHO2_02_FULL_63_14]|nr:MAG: hypothetical protein A3D28_00610 [Omnitrophica bacterium RIFCSPHIGHO2_02_FULL_63_14]
MHKFLDEALKKDASDLHLTVGHPPFLRLKSHLAYIDAPAIKEGQIRAMLYPLLSPEQIAHYEAAKELNFAFSPTPTSRFRGNLHQQRGSLEATLRNLPSRIRRFEELGLDPVILQGLAQKKSGLFLIAGHTGSGKTTTVAAIIDYLNREQEKVIITIEDPIEYMFIGNKSIIKQRELGHDTRSYDEALKNAMRQDPDVICVGEILTPGTVKTALRAAETGHLVITTIHAGDSVQALERLVNVFDPQGAQSAAQQVANALIAVLYQRLLPSVDGSLLLASELLLNTPAVRNQITERKFTQVSNNIVTGRELGMYTFQSSLDRLHKKGVISNEVYRENSAGL